MTLQAAISTGLRFRRNGGFWRNPEDFNFKISLFTFEDVMSIDWETEDKPKLREIWIHESVVNGDMIRDGVRYSAAPGYVLMKEVAQ